MMREIWCEYLTICNRSTTVSCFTCKNNRYRNKEIDCFVEAKDNPIPKECPKLYYRGPVEHTAGYKCPVCEEYTDPYEIKDNRCKGCGYKLNTQGEEK